MPKTEQASKSKDKATVKPTTTSSTAEKFSWPFTRKNLIWFIASVVVILVGYVFLGIGPYDSFSSLTVGPMLLVLGYLVLLPISIVVRDKPQKS